MNYIQVNISFPTATTESREIITAELSDLGYDSFMETDEGLLAYIPEADFNEKEILTLKDHYQNTIEFGFDTEIIEQKNWNSEWESNYQPINVDNNCLVRAPFHTIKGDFSHIITIEPKMSFGTGHHETTYLMIKSMLAMDFEQKAVLDMGCGTGILAILAGLKKASRITAIDIDTWAYENTIENAVKNKVTRIKAIKGDASAIPVEKYDIILANINRNILLNDMPKYASHLKTTGTLLLSGIYRHDLPVIQAQAQKQGLTLTRQLEKNNWIAVEFKA